MSHRLHLIALQVPTYHKVQISRIESSLRVGVAMSLHLVAFASQKTPFYYLLLKIFYFVHKIVTFLVITEDRCIKHIINNII